MRVQLRERLAAAMVFIVAAIVSPTSAMKFQMTAVSLAFGTIAYTCASGPTPNCAIAAAASIFLAILSGWSDGGSGTQSSPARRAIPDTVLLHKGRFTTDYGNGTVARGLHHHDHYIANPQWTAVDRYGNRMTHRKLTDGRVAIGARMPRSVRYGKRDSEIAGMELIYNDHNDGESQSQIRSNSESNAHDLAVQWIEEAEGTNAVDGNFEVDSNGDIFDGQFSMYN